jgi:hypothetical protein
MPTALMPPVDLPDPLSLLAAEVRRQFESKRDLMADTRLLSLSVTDEGVDDEDVRLLVDLAGQVEDLDVTRHAHGQIASHLGVGWRLYDRLLNGQEAAHKVARWHKAHPDLLCGLVNGLLAREPRTMMVRTLDGVCRAFLTNAYRPRDNYDLLEAVLPVIAEYPQASVQVAALTDTNLYIKIALPLAKPIPALNVAKVGDVLHAGIIFRNSEVGAGSLLIAPYTTVLSCTNGQVHTAYGSRQRHVGQRLTNEDAESWELYSDRTIRLDDEAYFSKAKDLVRAALSEEVFNRIVADMEELADIRIDAPAQAAVEVLGKRIGTTEEERGSILNHLIEGGNLTAWGYVQAVTATARDLEDVARQTELQTQAGDLIARPASWVPAMQKATV